MIKEVIRFILWKVFKYDTWSLVIHTSLGQKFNDEHILLIQRNDTRAGLFSYFLTNLGWVGYAKENMLRPVVDMATFSNIYKLAKGDNSWERFFEQPDAISLQDASKAKKVTIVRGTPPKFPFLTMDFFNNVGGALSYWQDICRMNIHLKKNILEHTNEDFENAVTSGKRILGVLLRGTDYVALRPKGHPVQPSIKEAFVKIDDLESEFDYIYLVTEDELIKKSFVERYDSKLLLAKQNAISYNGGYLSENAAVSHNVNQGIDYLRAVYDLSRCNYLVAGRTSGAAGAIVMRQDVNSHFVFDLGTYV